MTTPNPTSLRHSFRACRRITMKASSTFFLASLLFDADTRRDLWALYAFCRIADDIADESKVNRTATAKRADLRAMREAILTGKPARIDHHTTNIWPAVFDIQRRHKLPAQELIAVLRGVARDLRFNQPHTWSELDDYSYLVAGVVGVLSARILGAFHTKTLEGSKQLGIAMQYTNIMRDVQADLAMGRVYLPASIMREARLTLDQLRQSTNIAGLQSVLKRMGERAEQYYEQAHPSISDLHPSYRRPVLVTEALYRGILDRIKQKRYTVLDGRISLSRREKLQTVWSIYHAR